MVETLALVLEIAMDCTVFHDIDTHLSRILQKKRIEFYIDEFIKQELYPSILNRIKEIFQRKKYTNTIRMIAHRPLSIGIQFKPRIKKVTVVILLEQHQIVSAEESWFVFLKPFYHQSLLNEIEYQVVDFLDKYEVKKFSFWTRLWNFCKKYFP